MNGCADDYHIPIACTPYLNNARGEIVAFAAIEMTVNEHLPLRHPSELPGGAGSIERRRARIDILAMTSLQVGEMRG